MKRVFSKHKRKGLRNAAHHRGAVRGLSHPFYRYPARFSPSFARQAIHCFSKEGDVVLDPFMGGGTTILESLALRRRAIGCDINELAVFIAKVKTTRLSRMSKTEIEHWADVTVPSLRCNRAPEINHRPRNMNLPGVRWIHRMIALLLESIDEELPGTACQRFARCVVLNAGQWALNGRRVLPTAQDFRERIRTTAHDMLSGIRLFEHAVRASERPVLLHGDAEQIHEALKQAPPIDLVVTSPPYPGIHMLYHRWQVDGRKETDAPYWISASRDGAGTSYYNFADRSSSAALDKYFEKTLRTFNSIRRVLRPGAVVVQLVAFASPRTQLPRYLDAMREAGFTEARKRREARIWRYVPSRQWHATLKGALPSSREVVLLHRAN